MLRPSAPRTEVVIRSRPFITCSAIHTTMLSQIPIMIAPFRWSFIPLAIRKERGDARKQWVLRERRKSRTVPILCGIVPISCQRKSNATQQLLLEYQTKEGANIAEIEQIGKETANSIPGVNIIQNTVNHS